MATLVDGLGGEELSESGIGFSGAANASPYIPGSLTVEGQISGASVESTGDITGENVYGDTEVSGALLTADVAEIAVGSIVNIGGVTAISGTTFRNVQGTLRSASVGSAYGMQVQAGSQVLSSNEQWVEFPIGFTSNTGSQIIVLTTSTHNPDESISVSEISLGSFHASGTNASDTFNWIAVGI